MSATDNQRDAPADDKQAITAIFAKRLRYWRQERGLSLKALAKKAGVGEMTIVAYEQNIRTAGIDKVAALAKALDVTVTDLLDDCGDDSEQRLTGYLLFAQRLGLYATALGATQIAVGKSKRTSLAECAILDKSDFVFKIGTLADYALSLPSLRNMARAMFFDTGEPK